MNPDTYIYVLLARLARLFSLSGESSPITCLLLVISISFIAAAINHGQLDLTELFPGNDIAAHVIGPFNLRKLWDCLQLKNRPYPAQLSFAILGLNPVQ